MGQERMGREEENRFSPKEPASWKATPLSFSSSSMIQLSSSEELKADKEGGVIPSPPLGAPSSCALQPWLGGPAQGQPLL